jgi:hypothetical protein
MEPAPDKPSIAGWQAVQGMRPLSSTHLLQPSHMYADFLKEKFPQDDKNGLYRKPNLPAVKLGKLLIKDRRISSPNDVVAMHYYSGFLGDGMLLFTSSKAYYEGGSFLLEDIKEVQVNGSKMTVFANQQGQFVPHQLSVKNEQVANTLQRLLERMASKDPVAQQLVAQTYEGHADAEINWLNLRDDIMRTIDMLYERYNDGKLSLLEYEAKKDELLGRL